MLGIVSSAMTRINPTAWIKTTIAVAHRLSTIAAMDRLVVMDNGTIIEEGTHERLISQDGLYAQLWARQSGGFLVTDRPDSDVGSD